MGSQSFETFNESSFVLLTRFCIDTILLEIKVTSNMWGFSPKDFVMREAFKIQNIKDCSIVSWKPIYTMYD
jgi:hypothetical protein